MRPQYRTDHPVVYLVNKRLESLQSRSRRLCPYFLIGTLIVVLSGRPELALALLVLSLCTYYFVGLTMIARIWIGLGNTGGLEELQCTGVSAASMVDAVAYRAFKWILKPLLATVLLIGSIPFSQEGPFFGQVVLGTIVAGAIGLLLAVYALSIIYMLQLFTAWSFGTAWSLSGVVVILALNVVGWVWMLLLGAAAAMLGTQGLMAGMLLTALLFPLAARYGAILGLKHRQTLKHRLELLVKRNGAKKVTTPAEKPASPVLSALWRWNPVAATVVAPLATRNPLMVLGYLLVGLCVPFYVLAIDLGVTVEKMPGEALVGIVFLSLFMLPMKVGQTLYGRIGSEVKNGQLQLLMGTGLSSSDVLNGWFAGGVAKALWFALLGLPLGAIAAAHAGAPGLIAYWLLLAGLLISLAAEATISLGLAERSLRQRLTWVVLDLAQWAVLLGLAWVSLKLSAVVLPLVLALHTVLLRRRNLDLMDQLGFSRAGYR